MVVHKEMATLRLATTTYSIGNCKVEVPSNVDREFTTNKLCLRVCEPGTVTIAVEQWENLASEVASLRNAGRVSPIGLSFQLLNPKCLDEEGRKLLKGAVRLYHQELPAMSFAANTGKASDFLQACTTSGKYCTLVVTICEATSTGKRTVIGAITYQILPPDTQFAEIPLAAIEEAWQRKGLGGLLFRELARRLADVGVLSLFCWGDQESEVFWNKQGFLKIAGVDGRGKPQKLPLRADVRKAMSLPGSATLMVCNLRSSLPQLSSSITSVSKGEVPPENESERTKAPRTHVGKSEVRPPSEIALECPRLSPQSGSIASDICSPIPASLNRSPDHVSQQAPMQNSSKATVRPKAAGRGLGTLLNAIGVSVAGSEKESSARFSRTLKYPEVHEHLRTDIKNGNSGSQLHGNMSLAPGTDLTRESPEPQGLKPEVMNSYSVVTETPPRESGASRSVLQLTGQETDVSLRKPFKDVQNTNHDGNPSLSRKRALNMTQCCKGAVLGTQVHPLATITIDPNNSNGSVLQGSNSVEEAKSRAVGKTAMTGPAEQLKAEGTKMTKSQHANTVITKTVPKKLDILVFQPPSKRGVATGTPDVDALQSKTDIPDPSTDKENNEPAIIETNRAEIAKTWASTKSVQKRTREELKAMGPKMIKKRRGNSTMANKPASKKPVVLAVELVAPSKLIVENELFDAVSIKPKSDAAVAEGENLKGMSHKADECSTQIEGICVISGNQQKVTGAKHPDVKSIIKKNGPTGRLPVYEVATESTFAPEGELIHPDRTSKHVIFLSSMPNNSKKAALAKLVKRLGGEVTADGGQCTHVVAEEVRRTINLCAALCKGAWIVTLDWLNASSRRKSFVDEKPYLLRDRQFESKYHMTVASVIQTAQKRPSALLAGYVVYPTSHLQPPLHTIKTLTEAAGGKVLSSLNEALQQDEPSQTIVLACEEDMEEGISAAKAGLRTFSGEWFMQSMVKQNLDLSANLIEKL